VSDSFAEYVAGRGHALTRMAYLLTSDHALAEDLVQAALAKAFSRWSRIEAMAAPDAYVRRMIVNEHVSGWRRYRRREKLQAELPQVHPAGPADGLEAEQVVRAMVRAAVRGLPARQRAALVLRFYEDLPDADVAEVLGCSPATVRSQIARALARLRETAGLADLVNQRGE
jgi:RNA polymerase sigma-70 factor (sigma-E family)